MADKNLLRKRFSGDWKKHYKTEFLVKKGFTRKKCASCGKFFWALDSERKKCADSGCVGYEFIGKSTKKLDYVSTWEEIEKYFKRTGHGSIKRYPTVCRWRDDLYFTNASIIDFQPYVVNGEVEPPANPLIVPQACIRFGDIGNVGVTGAHYTSFIMFGQHAFNSRKTGNFYWKNEALEHDFNYLTKVIGVKKEDLVFLEDVWAGGGSFGPSLEYLSKGLELGNCVFMQFEELEKGRHRELKTKVIDMGAGLERLAWYTNGTPTSYDITFREVLGKLKKDTGVKVEQKLFTEYARLAGGMNLDEVKSLGKEKQIISKKLGVEWDELQKQLAPMQALYAAADHLKTVLYAVTDGMLPSNSAGGYNLRMILRRVFGFEEEFGWKLDLRSVNETHARSLKRLDSLLGESVGTANEILGEEKKKFRSSLERGKKKVDAMAGKERIGAKELRVLYESDGIPAETVKEIAEKKGVKVEIPENFYANIAKKNEVKEAKLKVLKKPYPQTKALFHEMPYVDEFTAKVLGVEGNSVVLDRTLFYAESGGQMPDLGQLNGVEVVDVEKAGGVVLHEVKAPRKFRKGLKVFGKIDWVRRHDLMRHHTATHLLNAAARELFGNHVWQAGAEKRPDSAHIDLTHFKRISGQEIEKLELLVNKMIQDNLGVRGFFMDRGKAEQKFGFRIYQGGFVPGKELRIIEVKGVDVQACGGTHLKSTGETGFFKIVKRESVKDGVERIYFKTGVHALQLAQKTEQVLRDSAGILCVPEAQLTESTQRFFNEWKSLRKQLKQKQRELISFYSEKLTEKERGGKIKAFIEGMDGNELIELGNRLLCKNHGLCAVLGSGEEIVVVSGKDSGKNAQHILDEILRKCGGVGGGKERLARGKVKNTEALKNLLD